MCWTSTSFNHCYECAKTFNHRPHKIPCHAAENNQKCIIKRLDHEVVHTGENCAECKASRAAEEECQRMIYRSRPLVLDVKGKDRMRALALAYRQDLSIRRNERQQLAKDIAAYRELNSEQDVPISFSGEDVVIPSMFIMLRHQRNTFYETRRDWNGIDRCIL
ncbi:hypothetical protein F5Y03DRAFT_397380 [Xylaria venustula]|nr:hypothetical protein F5Y03DRAFT_397380 [Xylaria venustula]